MISQLLQQPVRDFIKTHIQDDPAGLALKHREIAGTDIKLIAEQVHCRQKAAGKLPEWAENYNLIFPGAVAVEQASSKLTAGYKSSLFKGRLAYDLTGGLGIDALALSSNFEYVIYIEADGLKAEIARHNFKTLAAENIEVINTTAEDFLATNPEKAELIYLDPDRRPGEGRVFSLEKSTPDVVALKEKLFDLSDHVLIKASPMLDITAARRLLPEIVGTHVVGVLNECRELLFILEKRHPLPHYVIAANFNGSEWMLFKHSDKITSGMAVGYPENYIYEPNAAIIKAGIQNAMASEYQLKKLHSDTQLFTRAVKVVDFPGRIFKLLHIIPVNKKILKSILPGMKANLATRNFPEHIHKLKKKLNIKDGGGIYIFACRLSDQTYKLLITEKA